MSIHSDILIIGAGPGGYETAAEAAASGKKVTLIERSELGGTCLNRGCIPTKCLCRSAEVLRTLAAASEFGVETSGFHADYGKAAARMRGIVGGLQKGVAAALRNVDVVRAEARFTAPGQVTADGETYTADRIIIATGSAPARLPIEGAELAVSSDEVLALDELPASAVIIGGGVIGMELACIMSAFGTRVEVIEYCKEILPPFDCDIAKRLRTQLTRDPNLKITVGAEVKSVARDASAGQLSVAYQDRRGLQNTSAEMVVMAVGRRPVVPEGCDLAGIETGRKGIVTDDSMLTTAPGVYAIGDCNGRCMLAHAASAQGMVALGRDMDLSVVPSAVFTSPEAAMVGLTEEQCKERGLQFSTGKALFGANGKAVAMGEATGLVKVIAETATGKILGVHILGPHAADLIQEPATAMAAGLGAADIRRAIHAHPTLGETVRAAFMNLII